MSLLGDPVSSRVETTLTPINGTEAKKIIKSQMLQKIDKIPYLSEGNAFKRVVIGFDLIFEAFPPDCPVPSAEWQILIGLPNGEDLEFDKDIKKLEMLEEKKLEFIKTIERIEKFIAKHKVSEASQVRESDNGTPDELRIKHGLKVPVIKTAVSGNRFETKVSAKDLKK